MTAVYQLDNPGGPLYPSVVQRRPLGRTDVRVALKYCGICHSDLVAASNALGEGLFPMVPGHEMVGEVIELGDAVSEFTLGDPVGIGCIADSCGDCGSCQVGDEHYCSQGFTLSFNSRDGQGNINYGGYSSDYVVDQHYLIPLPKDADLAPMAPLLCGGITVYNPLKRFEVGPGTVVCVLGMGGLGHLAVQFARAMGATVLVASRSEDKRDDALRLGAEAVVAPDSESFQQWSWQCDLILDTISNPHDLSTWLPLLKRNGKLCLVGVPTESLSLFPAALVFGDKCIAGSLIGGIAATREMVAFAHEHGVSAEIELIQPEGINDAWTRLEEGDVRYRFVIDLASLSD